MLSSVSVSSITSITTMFAIGVTAASALLCGVFIVLMVAKELSVSYQNVDQRVLDSLNAAILPIMFAFVTLVAIQAF